MKKKVLAMLLMAALSVSIAACGNAGTENSGTGDKDNQEVSAKELAQSLATEITYTGKMEQLPEDEVEWYIDLEEGVTGIVYEVAGVSCEQVAVFTVPDDDAADKVITGLEELLADQKQQNAAYDAKVASRIESAVLEHKEDYVILCVSDDSAKAKEIIKEAFGE